MSRTLTQNSLSETTPLLDDKRGDAVERIADVYDRFTPGKRRFIACLVSSIGLMPLLVYGMLAPSLPQVAEDLNSNADTVGLAVSISIMMTAIETPIWASLSTFYGRRPVYIFGLPLLVLGSIGVGHAGTAAELLIWRVVQAIGTVGGISIGAGVIGDIYRVEERGTAMGAFYAVILFGPALAPLFGGFVAQYASWRVTQYALGVAAAILFTIVFLFFPETMHPNERGIEKLNATLDKPRRFVFINPFRSLTTLRGPTFCALMFTDLALLLTQNILQVPLAYTIGVRYNIVNKFFVGASFIPWGIGSIIGASIAGVISDRLVVIWRNKRNGVRVPEDRLRGAILAAATFVPLSMVAAGITTQYVDGRPGMALTLISVFFNGLGVNLVLTPIGAYCVDVMGSRGAETLAAISAVRGALLGLAVAGILPSIRQFGVAITDIGGACFAWIGALLLWIVIRYGRQLRNWSGVGVTPDDN